MLAISLLPAVIRAGIRSLSYLAMQSGYTIIRELDTLFIGIVSEVEQR